MQENKNQQGNLDKATYLSLELFYFVAKLKNVDKNSSFLIKN